MRLICPWRFILIAMLSQHRETLLAQSKGSLEFPTYFQFIAAMNACPYVRLDAAKKPLGVLLSLHIPETHLRLLASACHRILKLALVIADLAEREDTQSAHLAEALEYRSEIMMG